MSNTDKFKVGTVFVGNESKHRMKILKIEERVSGVKNGNNVKTNKIAVIKDMTSGKKFCYRLNILEKCDITIVA